MRPDAQLDACRRSHERLLESIERLSDEHLRAPSRLPGYTRAHVVAHLANKAEAHVWVLGGPAAGEVRRLHPADYDADAAAQAGADRSAAALRSDLRASLADLETAWRALDDSQWDQLGVMTVGPRTMAEIVGHHLRNVEVHHVDLDVGYEPTDWPPDFVDDELDRRLRTLRGRADDAELLAWLLGRGPAPTLGPW